MANQFLVKSSIAELRGIPSNEITDLQNGVYEGVLVLGYYEKGDTPNPIVYYLSSTNEVDDGGSVIEGGGIKFEHKFEGDIDVKYFGASNNFNFSEVINKVISYIKKIKKGQLVISDYYYCNENIVIDKTDGLIIKGVNSNSPEQIGSPRGCGIDFTNNISLERNFLISNFTNLKIQNINLVDKKTDDGGVLIELNTGHGYELNNLGVLNFRGNDSISIKLGDDKGENSVFQGSVKDIKIVSFNSKGIGIRVGATNTSTNFLRVYLTGCPFLLVGCTYTSLISCAVDGSYSSGYILKGLNGIYCNTITFISCGAEYAQNSGWLIKSGCRNIDIQSPHSGNNNTLNSDENCDLLYLDVDDLSMGINSIRISSPEIVFGKKYSIFGNNELIGSILVENFSPFTFGKIGGDINFINKSILIGNSKIQSNSFENNSFKISENIFFTETLNGLETYFYPKIDDDYVNSTRGIQLKAVRFEVVEMITGVNNASVITDGTQLQHSLGVLDISVGSKIDYFVKFDDYTINPLGFIFIANGNAFTGGKIKIYLTYEKFK